MLRPVVEVFSTTWVVGAAAVATHLVRKPVEGVAAAAWLDDPQETPPRSEAAAVVARNALTGRDIQRA